jgi:nucleotide-binding universal stress UspA family protein
MSASQYADPPFIRSVFHPSDFSPASRNAFAAALAIALLRQAQLTMLHVVPEDRAVDVWTDFPSVRETLQSWGLLEPGSPRSAVFESLGVGVKKVNVRNRKVLAAVHEYLDEYPTDLIVLATEGRKGLPRWIETSKAEELAHRTSTMTLFVPSVSHGLVAIEDGSMALRRILVPVDHQPSPQIAAAYATRAAGMAGGAPVEIKLLHIGEPDGMPAVELPEAPGCSWERICRPGKVVDEIIKAAEAYSVDLIVMSTEGRDGILDALRGSNTEQVLRRVSCPLLAVPVA